jgi:hypothetical protein
MTTLEPESSEALDQPPYVKILEDRLHDLEQRLLAVEGASERAAVSRRSEDGSEKERATSDLKDEEDAAQTESSNRGGKGKNDAKDFLDVDKDNPPFPPTIPVIQKISFQRYYHRDLGADNQPAVAILYYETGFEEEKARKKEFEASLTACT